MSAQERRILLPIVTQTLCYTKEKTPMIIWSLVNKHLTVVRRKKPPFLTGSDTSRPKISERKASRFRMKRKGGLLETNKIKKKKKKNCSREKIKANKKKNASFASKFLNCYLVPLFETRSFAVPSVNKYLRTVCKVWKWKRFSLWEWKEVSGWFTACFLCYYSAKCCAGKKTSEEEINIKFRLIDTVCFILISSKLQADRTADT